MNSRKAFLVTVLACGGLLAACGGGGGGGSAIPSAPGGSSGGGGSTGGGGGSTVTNAPTAAPSGAPATLPSSSAASPSGVTINSLPAGLAVSIDGSSSGLTPLTPSLGFGAHTITIAPNSGPSPYTVTISNTGSGAIALLYDQTADSSGSLGGGVATTAASRAPAGRSAQSVGLMRPAASAAQLPAFSDRRIEVEYDTTRLRGATFAQVEGAHGATDAQTLLQAGPLVTRTLSVASGTNLDASVAGLRAEPGVLWANRVGLRYPAASSSGPVYPNDTYFEANANGMNGDQWYLWLIDAQDAWGYGQGRAPLAVVDTGYDPLQSDLASQVTFSETVVNLLRYANTATDRDGHGTFLSGVAGAQTNNGAGFAGAGYNVPLQEYKIFADGSSSAQTTDEAVAIRDAVANGAKVILLALQGSPANGPDPAERDAVAFAISSGVTVVAASGDDNGSALDYPAAYPGVISVGASIVNDAGTAGVVVGQGNSEQVASYSNAGPGLGLVAPGGQGSGNDADLLHWIENLYTTQPSSGLPACASGGTAPSCRILFTGTSPAAALVAGTAALMLSVNGGLSPANVAQMLYATTDDIKDAREGHGRLNAQRAVALAAGDSNPQPAFPLPRAVQFVAFAYTNSGAALPVAPAILDTLYKNGVPVNQNGTFRIADINPSAVTGTGYKIGLWLSLAGDGKVHPGDYFTAIQCTTTASCTGALANVTAVKLSSTATTLP